MTSASETLATVTPMAPARRSKWAIAGHLNALAWGRQATPAVSQVAGHPIDILLQEIEVDQEGGGIQLGHRQTDRAELHRIDSHKDRPGDGRRGRTFSREGARLAKRRKEFKR